jgi:hypothetical protein
MRVFISWSGEPSRSIARSLNREPSNDGHGRCFVGLDQLDGDGSER